MAISTLITDAVSTFIENEDAIMKGDFDVSLLDKSKYKAQTQDIIQLSIEKMYRSQEVLEKEIAGYRVIADILEIYTDALLNTKDGKVSNYDRLIINTLPDFYQSIDGSVYDILLNTCCYVASLSDSAAIHIHNKVMGKKF